MSRWFSKYYSWNLSCQHYNLHLLRSRLSLSLCCFFRSAASSLLKRGHSRLNRHWGRSPYHPTWYVVSKLCPLSKNSPFYQKPPLWFYANQWASPIFSGIRNIRRQLWYWNFLKLPFCRIFRLLTLNRCDLGRRLWTVKCLLSVRKDPFWYAGHNKMLPWCFLKIQPLGLGILQ